VKYLIVNGDDFGASRGINRAILEAHQGGILTSTSLFVDRPWSDEAARLARETPSLGVGLHADLDSCAPHEVGAALRRQLARFEDLMGAAPTHLDSHHNVHRRPEVLPECLTVAKEQDLLVRDFSEVRYVPDFYGQRRGVMDLRYVGVASLIELLRSSVTEGMTELGCHPGYVDADFVSRYTTERECELRTLCDLKVREAIRDLGIVLVSFRDVRRLLADSGAARMD
jgi:chitin disaccharide deacetylase